MKKLVVGLVAFGFAVSAVPGFAREAGSEWEWRITPYAFLTGMDVTSTVAGTSVPVELDFGEVVDTFDVRAFSTRFEGWKGAYGFVLDWYWVDLDTEQGGASVDLEQTYLDVLAGYRFVKEQEGYRMDVVNEFTLGARFNRFKQEIGLPPGTLGGEEDWVDLMLGYRAIYPVHPEWFIVGRADVGGFGWSDSADISASLTLGGGWNFHRNWALGAGYRYYALDYSTTRPDGEFGIDGNFDGLYLALTWDN